ncbi:hypothetical protein BKA62DRAFT_509779 [Auriculariales sp. MPI-PUGE-AT-0066]|nr:hypothetical protein BKA62DRAFT_509779 [Auriculariales sp. MPI-PUGE-AT-0066]
MAKDRPKRHAFVEQSLDERVAVAAAVKRNLVPRGVPRGLALKWERQLKQCIRMEVRRLINMQVRCDTNFWMHLGHDPEKILVSRRVEQTESIALSRCLRFQHCIKTYDDALTLLNIWHSILHIDTSDCACGACSDSRVSTCTDALRCRRYLTHLLDTKDLGEWNGRTFPALPDDSTASAETIYAFTMSWDGTGTAPFDRSMRDLL